MNLLFCNSEDEFLLGLLTIGFDGRAYPKHFRTIENNFSLRENNQPGMLLRGNVCPDSLFLLA